MRKKKINNKQRWINDIANFHVGWNRDWRKGLLHPQDVKNIHKEFNNLKLKIKKQKCTSENETIYCNDLSYIYKLVSKADERMTTMCTILTELMSIK